jgi:Plasmid replication region DNA-binding N-term
MTAYHEVKDIVQRLVAEGYSPSRKRVRRELGDQGSYQTIGTMIDQALAELGLQQPREDRDDGAEDRPEPDPAAVATPPTERRDESAFAATDRQLRALLAVARDLPSPLEATLQQLNRQDYEAQRQAGVPVDRLMFPPYRHMAAEITTHLAPLVLAVIAEVSESVSKTGRLLLKVKMHNKTAAIELLTPQLTLLDVEQRLAEIETILARMGKYERQHLHERNGHDVSPVTREED